MDFHVGIELPWCMRPWGRPWCRGALYIPCSGLSSSSAKLLSCGVNTPHKNGIILVPHIPSPSSSYFFKPVSPLHQRRQHGLNKQVISAHARVLLLLWLLLISPFGEPGKQNNIETRQQQRLPLLMVRDLTTAALMRFGFLVGRKQVWLL